MTAQDGAAIARDGFFQGYTPLVWGCVLNGALGGILVAVVVKYANNILKGFATAVSVVMSAAFSIAFLEFEITGAFLTGALLVVASIFVYNTAPAPGARVAPPKPSVPV